MRTLPPVTVTPATADEIRARVEAWKSAHPGFDERNFADAFRDGHGELVESPEFFAASNLFGLYATIAR